MGSQSSRKDADWKARLADRAINHFTIPVVFLIFILKPYASPYMHIIIESVLLHFALCS